MTAGRATLLWPVLLGLLGSGCGERSVTVRLRSLLASGEVTHVCRQGDDGVPLEDCNPLAVLRGSHDLYALVTQTSTGEVAIINVAPEPSSQAGDEGVVDVDPSTPGYGFLRVGARPGDIVSTPGGQASFVASGQPGRPGIFALPTSCLGPPGPDEPPRDLTSWAACSLPVTPGNMAVIIDRPDAAGVVYETCDHEIVEGSEPPPGGMDQLDCPANLLAERGLPGRRKLLVALPDRGSLAILDAQRLLDREPGSFQPCEIENELSLRVDFPAAPVAQVLPPDLAGTCVPEPVPLPPAPLAFAARPAGFARADSMLYVADQDAPVVHAVDLGNACSPTEAPPLLPQSYGAPGRVVTTSKLAVSPLTPAGRRFVYAIDELDWPSASVMVFDVSPGSTDRTPLVRSGTPFFPYEPADRIQFSASARDLSFVFRDRPIPERETGVAPIGHSCDPRPDGDALGASYRPNSDYSSGARALELRGVFALVMLSNGRVEVIDVEDFDAPCRRPVAANPGLEPDFRGCAGDPPEIEEYVDSTGARTVSDEASCRIVQPHRARSAFLVGTSPTLGVHAPALRSFPQLTVPEVAAQTTRLERPKLLGVDFPGPDGGPRPATVKVGTTEYVHEEGGDLVLDPARATQHSVVLPFVEPRAYLPSERFLLTYEGVVAGEFPAGFFALAPDGRVLLQDAAVVFCDGSGLNDVRLARELGTERFELEGDALESFARRSADHVVITADFPDEDDAYWSGASCDRRSCQAEFGAFDAKQLSPGRELDVLEAEQQRLWLEPRLASPELVECCFPSGTSYLVRASEQWVLRGTASGFRHDVTARYATSASGETILQCVRDCHPRKRYFRSRVFEISAASCAAAGSGEPEDCGVGAAEPDDICVVDGRAGGVRLEEPAARCIQDTPTGRFVVYRGTAPTTTDSMFVWDTLGGFVPLGMDLTAASSQVSPQELVVLPEMDLLSVIDASNLGLALLSLDRLSVLTPTFN